MLKNNLEISIPYIRGNSKKYLNQCIDTNFVSSVGPFVDLFEKALAEELGIESKMVTATNSGTSALQLSLIAMGIQKEDLVLIPSYTFIATANSVSNAGGIPWLIDVSQKNLTIDIELLYKELNEKTYLKNGTRFHKELNKRIFAIIPVHVFGFPPNLDEIYKLSKKYNLKVISDAAGGLGSSYKGKLMGDAIEHGIISFNGNKIITAGGGGLFFSKDFELVNKVKHLASTARKTSDYIHDFIGFNFRISNLHAALGLSQIECFKYILKRKHEISNLYKKELHKSQNIHFIKPEKNSSSSNWLNAILIKKNVDFELNNFISYMREHKINIRPYWRPVHLQPPYLSCPRSKQEVSKRIFSRVIVLPSSTNIEDKEIKFVSEKILNYFPN